MIYTVRLTVFFFIFLFPCLASIPMRDRDDFIVITLSKLDTAACLQMPSRCYYLLLRTCVCERGLGRSSHDSITSRMDKKIRFVNNPLRLRS